MVATAAPSRSDALADEPFEPGARPATHDALDGIVLAAGGFLLAASWLGLVLAELGLFAGWAGSAAAVLVGLAAAAAIWRQTAIGRSRLDRATVVGALILLIAGGLLFGRPHEYALGGLDPGVYVNTAALIAETGGVVWHDPELAALDPAGRAALFRERPALFTEGSRFIGFYLTDTASGRVVPHGLHLFPAALAVGFGLAGLAGALAVPPLLALSAVAAVGLLARRLAGTIAGGLAALLLLVNPAESWFGRYPAAELVVQAGLFVGLLTLAVALARGSTALGAAAGLELGVTHLAKVDTFAIPIAVAIALGGVWLAGRATRVHAAFIAGYCAMLAHALVHIATISTYYVYSTYSRYIPPLWLLGICLGLAALLVGGIASGRTRRRLRVALDRAAPRWAGPAWLLLAAAVLAAVAYAWYLRPLDPFGEIAAAPEAARFVVRNRLHALPRLAWFLPALTILAAVAGFLTLARRRLSTPQVILLLVVGIEAIVVLADPRITPEYPWAARRWVAVLIPAGIMLAAVQIAALLPRSARWPRTADALAVAILPGSLAAAMILASIGAAAPLLRVRELVGNADLVHRIAAAMPADAVVIFDDDLVGYRLSLPMQILGHRSSFVTFGEVGKDEQIRIPIAQWLRAERPIFWLRHELPKERTRWGLAWLPVETWQMRWVEAQPTTETAPTQIRQMDLPLTLYRAAAP